MLSHEEASRLIASFAAGELDFAQALRMEGHISDCADCQEWMEVYSRLSSMLASKPMVHLGSEEIARLAAELPESNEAHAHRVRTHLGVCARCAEELNITRNAIRHSRQSHGWRDRLRIEWPASLRPAVGWSLASAAVVAILLVVPVFLRSDHSLAPGNLQITGRVLSGTQVVEAPGSVLAERSQVGNDSEVTFRAGESVVFGEGFSVASSGRLQVEITETD
jgi:hypothetical protein